jgi:hypothetical protein
MWGAYTGARLRIEPSNRRSPQVRRLSYGAPRGSGSRPRSESRQELQWCSAWLRRRSGGIRQTGDRCGAELLFQVLTDVRRTPSRSRPRMLLQLNRDLHRPPALRCDRGRAHVLGGNIIESGTTSYGLAQHPGSPRQLSLSRARLRLTDWGLGGGFGWSGRRHVETGRGDGHV